MTKNAKKREEAHNAKLAEVIQRNDAQVKPPKEWREKTGFTIGRVLLVKQPVVFSILRKMGNDTQRKVA